MVEKKTEEPAVDPERGTGRTTRALEEVRELVEAGHSVVFVSHSTSLADRACGIMSERWGWNGDKTFKRELHLGKARVRFISARTFTRIAMTLRGTQDMWRLDHAFWDNIEQGSGCGDLALLAHNRDEILALNAAPPEAKGHHERLTRLANAATMLHTRLGELTAEEREMVDDWMEERPLEIFGADALEAILVTVGAGE